METKRVLVTGASGFIGRHAITSLRLRGYEVHGVSVQPIEPKNLYGCVWHQVNLLAPDLVTQLIDTVEPTHLLHLAWYTEHGNYWRGHQNLDWLTASLGLLKAFAKSKGVRVVIAGTCAEYDWQYGLCSEETTPTAPWSLYGISKHALQITASAFAREVGLSLAWGRIFFPFGPGEHSRRLIPSTVLSLLRKEPACCTQGEQIRDYIYVEDVADALVTLLDSDLQGPMNIGSGEPVTIKDLVSIIAKRLGQDNLLKLGALPARGDEPHMIVADITNLRTQLGWTPKHNLDSGIEKSLDWWKTQICEHALV